MLVADDQSMVRAGFRMLLSDEDGIEVVAEASNGIEAVAKAARFHPTVILMDIRMPEIDGLEAMRRIRAGDGPNRETRIIALTADVEPENLAACDAAGANGVLPKPISPAQLLAEVCRSVSAPAPAGQTRKAAPRAARA